MERLSPLSCPGSYGVSSRCKIKSAYHSPFPGRGTSLISWWNKKPPPNCFLLDHRDLKSQEEKEKNWCPRASCRIHDADNRITRPRINKPQHHLPVPYGTPPPHAFHHRDTSGTLSESRPSHIIAGQPILCITIPLLSREKAAHLDRFQRKYVCARIHIYVSSDMYAFVLISVDGERAIHRC